MKLSITKSWKAYEWRKNIDLSPKQEITIKEARKLKSQLITSDLQVVIQVAHNPGKIDYLHNIKGSQSIRSAQDGDGLQSAKTLEIPRINDYFPRKFELGEQVVRGPVKT